MELFVKIASLISSMMDLIVKTNAARATPTPQVKDASSAQLLTILMVTSVCVRNTKSTTSLPWLALTSVQSTKYSQAAVV